MMTSTPCAEGIEVIMFRTIGDGPSAWELLLPAEVLRLPEDLARVDALLDDPAFFAPFARYFHPVLGRPSTPGGCYLRLMFLKFRHRLGYESLCAEVSDSISWRRVCRIGLGGRGPRPTALVELRAPGGRGAVAGRVQAAGGATGTRMTDRRRAAARRVREIASKLHARGKLSREETTRAICRVTGELAGLAQKAAAQAAAVVRNGRRAVPKAISGRVRGRLVRALDELALTMNRTATLLAQAPTPLARQTPDGATPLVGLHDPDARPIRKGRIDKPVEFGYKAQVADNDDGVILDYAVEYGAAADGPQLAPAVERIRKRAGRVPRAVTADRGYGQPVVERDLHALGVSTVAIPRQSTTSSARKLIEHGRGFRRLVKWRTGCEGRISYLKRGYGWGRTRLDGRHGAAIWCGHAVFAHHLVKIAALASS